MQNDGIEIVLTPIQLAAILEEETIDSSGAASNRLWGVVNSIFGLAEIAGGVALFGVPDVTITKIAGGALVLHGADTVQAGAYSIWTGKSTVTLTAEAATAFAKLAGANEDTAKNVGYYVDLTVPLVAGFAGLARIAAVRSGRISLEIAEAKGGHTIKEHVGKSFDELLERLETSKQLNTVSSFRNLSEAEIFVSKCLQKNRKQIMEWAKGGSSSRKAFDLDVGKEVGLGVRRSIKNPEKFTKVRVVLRREIQGDKLYFILTSFPIP
ncbi:hypothetical protein ROS1_59860 [Roseibium sp. ROS1]